MELPEYLPEYVAAALTEDPQVLHEADDKYHAAVAVIRHRDKWLLGLSTAEYDDRGGKWCMVGGGIKSGETPKQAAVREAHEESGVSCQAIKKLADDPSKPGVAFVSCKASSSNQKNIKKNHEFSVIQWFTVDDMKSLKLYHNVKTLIRKAKS